MASAGARPKNNDSMHLVSIFWLSSDQKWTKKSICLSFWTVVVSSNRSVKHVSVFCSFSLICFKTNWTIPSAIVYEAFVRLIEKWSNTAAQSHFLCGGGLNIAENNCGVWSHDRREKSFSATLNSHLASALSCFNISRRYLLQRSWRLLLLATGRGWRWCTDA